MPDDTARQPEPTASGAKPAPAHDRAAAAGLPPDSGPEAEVTRIRQAMMRRAPLRFLLLNAGVLASLIGGIWLLVKDRPYWAGFVGVLGLACLVALIAWKVLTLATRLRVTNKRSIMTTGLLSKQTTEVLHDNIRNVKIDQSFWERVWNVGRISIASSGTDDEEIVMRGVPRPHDLARTIDLYRPLG